jgi:uncharacterized protein YbjT (DUF2867 family)
MILATGSSGNLGGYVLQSLLRHQQPVRALYRTKKDAANVPAGVEAVIADFADRDAMRRAVQGIDKVFLVCAPIPQLVELESNAIQACQEAGIQHLVLNSALGAGAFKSSFPSWHRQVEEALMRSGIPYTILRPNSFMQNILSFFAPSIRSSGVFYSSMGKARVSLIDARDIGEFVASVFRGPEHIGKTYELNGPEALTYDDVAQKIAETTGVTARYADIPVEQQRQSMQGMGMPEWQIEALLELQRYYLEGSGGEVDNLVSRVIGKPATRLTEFLGEFRNEFREQVQSA